jgi:hypothetical protein
VDVEDQIQGVVRRLGRTLAPAVPADVVEVEVRRSFADWADAPVRDFVPVLVERQVLGRLRAPVRAPRQPSPA